MWCNSTGTAAVIERNTSVQWSSEQHAVRDEAKEEVLGAFPPAHLQNCADRVYDGKTIISIESVSADSIL